MTDIEWGAEIAVNGVRPEWLLDKEAMNWRSRGESQWYGTDSSGYIEEEWAHPIHYIRLPATHPYYLATSRGFTYWPGGESAPEDWDGGEVLHRNDIVSPAQIDGWRCDDMSWDIVGYRRRTEQPAPAIAPELVDRMVVLVKYVADGGRAHVQRDAKAILAELEPDPDLTLAKSIVGDAEAIALAIKAARENGRG